VVRLHHIVLLVAAKPMLRTEGCGQLQASRRQRVEAMGEVARDRRRMGQECNALPLQRTTKLRLGEEPVDTEQGHGRLLRAGARRSKRRRGSRAFPRPDAPVPSRIWSRPSLPKPPKGRIPKLLWLRR